MGSIYAERVLGVAQPRVGVLSNGEEESKGNDLTRAASEQLAATFAQLHRLRRRPGYFQRQSRRRRLRRLYRQRRAQDHGRAWRALPARFLKSAFQKNLTSRVGYLISRKSLTEAYRRLDYAEYGGAPLIGLDGVAIIAHGGSNPLAIKNAIRAARDAVDQKMNRHIAEALGEVDGASGQEEKVCRANSGSASNQRSNPSATKTNRRAIQRNGGRVASSHIAFVFPGQGSQYVGMGKDLCEQFALARQDFCRSGRCARFFAERTLFRRSRSRSQADREYPTGDSHRVDCRVARARRAKHRCARPSSPVIASANIARWLPSARSSFATLSRSCASAAA